MSALTSVKQIIHNENGGVYALTESGDIFYGCFIQTRADQLTVPKFLWRRVPTIPDKLMTYDLQLEMTPMERAKAIKTAEKAKRQ